MTRLFNLPGRSAVHAVNAMASTSHPLATATALNVLREGGNAVDAAIAASATLCVVEPQMTGIGGDCFAIIAEADGKVHALNGSGRAAAAANADSLRAAGMTKIEDQSAHAVTVPGALRGWEKLHSTLGSMDWTRLFSDAVDLAAGGSPVAPRVAHDWAGQVEKLAANAGSKKHFLFDGKAPATGRKVSYPALGATLERIAREGADAFYKGEIAAEICATLRDLGGVMTEKDLAACTAEWVEPISTRFHGRDILEIPPNGQGITALILLNLIEAVNSDHEAGSAGHFHEMIELARIAYAVRNTHLADPDFMKASVEELLSPETTAKFLKLYDPEKRNEAITLPELRSSNTIYLSVVDREGRAVSFINSIFATFGSGITTQKSGICLQNRGAGFTLEEGHPNEVAGGKRPMHTIIPAMAMLDGKPEISFGVMGGQYQPMGQVHVLVNMLKYAMDPQEAVDFPRIFWNGDGVLEAESGISAETFKGLEARGHKVVSAGAHGGGQIIRFNREEGTLVAGSDPRKDGHAAGY